MKEKIAKIISKETKVKVEDIITSIEIPPKESLGDYAFPCFILAKKLKKSPLQIAEELTEKLRKDLPKEISNIQMKAGYVNFFLDKKILAKNVLENALKKDYGTNTEGKNKKVVIEMSSPNIAKPFGIGHLRSTIIGNSIAKIAESNGYQTIKINYLGDWGTQFGKVILGFKKWGDKEKLEKAPAEHLLEIYKKANDKKYESEARGEFKKLEDGEKENTKLWETFKKTSLNEFKKIYEMLNVKFDEISGESKYYDKMDKIIKELKNKKLLKKDEGAMIVNLKPEKLGVVLIQKSDGTTLYSTRDITAAIDRKERYNFHKMIYEVGSEQKLHFKQVFRVLEKMGYTWAKDCTHISHGLYLGKDGKKLQTRTGKTIFMKDVLNEVTTKAKKNLNTREKLENKEIEKRAKKIALAAIIYGDLKNARENNIIFDSDKFLSFEGNTGPYLLYSYARANSITKKVKSKKQLKIFDLKETETKLLKKINSFPDIIKKAYDNLSPNIIANYAFELAQNFNEFYHECPVIGSPEEAFRLKLTESFKTTLKKSLDLLGIDVLKKM